MKCAGVTTNMLNSIGSRAGMPILAIRVQQPRRHKPGNSYPRLAKVKAGCVEKEQQKGVT